MAKRQTAKRATDQTAPAEALLVWYDRHARNLPWRAPPGRRPPPAYQVWLSEIMLQQTTVSTVKPYFERFLERWPTIVDLADAPLEEVLAAWAGLGYYTRARKLHECAGIVARELDGHFPQDEDALRALPGIGPYTAAAVAAIAFNQPAAVVDGNIERVISRLFAIDEPLPASKPAIKAHVARLVPENRPGDFAQAMMDLGASLCSPKRPACSLCPWTDDCVAQARNLQEALPKKAPKPDRPTRRGAAFWLERADGHVALVRRPAKGLLGGMLALPCSDWLQARQSENALLKQAPIAMNWRRKAGGIKHTFTHFHLEMAVYTAKTRSQAPMAEFVWTHKDDVFDVGLPTVMKKVATLVLKP